MAPQTVEFAVQDAATEKLLRLTVHDLQRCCDCISDQCSYCIDVRTSREFNRMVNLVAVAVM